MEKPSLERLAVAFAFLLLIGTVLYSETQPYIEACVSQDDCTHYNLLYFIFLVTTGFFHDYEATFTALAGLAVAFFTYQLRVATVGLQTSTKKLWKAGEKQLRISKRALVASDRAWMRIDNIYAGQPVIINSDGVRTAIGFRLTNTGKSPATNITLNAKLVILGLGVDVLEEQRKYCDGIRNQPLDVGFSLFPDEKFPQNIQVGDFSLGLFLPAEKIMAGKRQGKGGDSFMLMVVGCIDYTFPSDPNRHHQTQFIREIAPKGSRLSTDIQTIDRNEIMVSHTVWANGQHID